MPRKIVPYLGFLSDSSREVFHLIPEKKEKFLDLIEQTLACSIVSVKSLQRLVGKCVSFSLVVRGALLFTGEMNNAISKALRTSYQVTWGTEGGNLTLAFSAYVGRPASLQGWTSYPHILSNRCLSLGLGWFNNFEWWYGWGLWLMDEGRAGAWYPHKGGTGAWQGPSFLRRLFKECMGRWPGWQSVSSLLLAKTRG